MKTITHARATPGQIKQISRFAADAVEKVLADFGPDHAGAQLVIERGNEFASAIREATMAALKDLSVSDKFKDEEVESSYGYLSGYKPKSISEQVACLRKLFPQRESPDLKLDDEEFSGPAEGHFAIPRWKKIAPTYCEAVQKVMALLKKARKGKFFNFREDELSAEQLREHPRKAAAFQKLGDEQKEQDVLLVPAQFGLCHRGRSVRRAREVFRAGEFGLGAFEVGIMLLTHPERLEHCDDLWIDCAGDEFSPDADGRFPCAPVFRFYDDSLKFYAKGVDGARDGYGSASGFFPQ